jgi:hypothetical protein
MTKPIFTFECTQGSDYVTKSFECMTWFEALDKFITFMNGAGFQINRGDVVINRPYVPEVLFNAVAKDVNDSISQSN